MMAGHVHAVILLAVTLLVPLFALRARVRPPEGGSLTRRAAIALLGALPIVTFCGVAAFLCACAGAPPVGQGVLPAAAWMTAGMIRLPGRVRLRLFAVCLLGSFLLSWHFLRLSHGRHHTSVPDLAWVDGARAVRAWHTPLTGLYSVEW